MKSTNHETENRLAAFAARGGNPCGGLVVRRALFPTGMALAAVLGLMWALSAPSLAQDAGGEAMSTTVRTAGDVTTVDTVATATPAGTLTTTTTTVRSAAGANSSSSATSFDGSAVAAATVTTTSTDITTSGAVSGGNTGVLVSRTGSGSVTLANDAEIKKITEHGIEAAHSGIGGLDIVNRGRITDVEKNGIDAVHSGGAAIHPADSDSVLKIRSTESIEAKERAISALHNGTGNIEIFANSSIQGDDYGVYAKHVGSGNLMIEAGVNGRSGSGAITSEGAGGKGIFARHEGSSGGINVDVFSGGSVASDLGDAVFIEHFGNSSEDVNLDIYGGVSGRHSGVSVNRNGTGDLNIHASSDIAGTNKGIFTRHSGDGRTYVYIESGASVTSTTGDAIAIEEASVEYEANSRVYRRIRVIAHGSVSGRDAGISITHDGSANYETTRVTVGPEGSVSGGLVGIRARYNGSARTVIFDVRGRVSSASGNAIDMAGFSSRYLRLYPGFSIDGTVVASGDEGASFLTLYNMPGGASRSGLLDFDESEFRGFDHLSTFGGGSWVMTGTMSEEGAFEKAVMRLVTLRFSDVDFKMVGSTPGFVINSVAVGTPPVLEIAGINTLKGNLLSGDSRIVFVQKENAYSSLTVSGDYWGIGDSHSLDFNVDLAEQLASKLTVQGNIGNSYRRNYSGAVSRRVSMHVSGTPNTSGVGAPPEKERTSPVLIEVQGDAQANNFSGDVDVGDVHNYALEHNDADGVHKWRFEYKGPSASAAAGASTATTLAELAMPQSTPQGSGGEGSSGLGFRADDRRHTGGAWARRQSSRALLEPDGAIDSRLRLKDNRVRFGFDLPAASLMGGDIIVGAGVWQGLSASDVSSPTGKGSVGVESHAAALTASWRSPRGLYADGQAQYARFSSDISAKGVSLVRDNQGSGASVSAEAGYRFEAPLGGMDFHIAPQMQMAWSRVGFEDFLGPNGGLISLEDGDLATGRLGLSWDGEWRDAGGSGHVYGGVNLRSALDGRTAVNVSGVSLASEQGGLSVDGRLGVSYEWDEGYAVHGEAVALRRAAAGEVRANLGVRIDF